MAAKKMTVHVAMDVRTGFSYAFQMDDAGTCHAIQALNTTVRRLDGSDVRTTGPGKAPAFPFGKTIAAVELLATGEQPKVFSLAFPLESEFKKGVMPTVSSQALPTDLIRAGFAPEPAVQTDAPKPAVDDASLKSAMKGVDAMIGLGAAKREISQNISLVRLNALKKEMGISTEPISRHMVFAGNPGTGKTTFAREVAKIYHALGIIQKPEVVEVKREDLIGEHIGSTEAKTTALIQKAKGGILFIDEAYALTAGDNSDGKDFGMKAINTLVAAMENMRDDLIVIVAGYTAPMEKFINSNEGLKSRFNTYITFDDYGMQELGQIMDGMLKSRGYVVDPKARAKALEILEEDKRVSGQSFGNGRSVRNLVQKMETALAMRLNGEEIFTKGKDKLSENDLRRKITTITLADVEKLSLQGISAPEPERVPVGFKPPQPSKGNDNIAGPRLAA